MKKIVTFLLFLIICFQLSVGTTYAVCPVCTVAVGAGLGLSRALGIDDAVTSIWIGGLILSMSFWAIDWLNKKRGKSLAPKYQVLTIVFMYLLLLVPLWYGKYIGRVNNTLFGIDKILFGTIVGSLVFILAKWTDLKVRQIKGKQLFNYQRVVFPVLSLIISSAITHFVLGRSY